MTVGQITSKAQFDELLASGKVVYVDFYADWCGPCKQISPHFKKLAEEHAKEDAVEFYKVDIDAVADLAQELGIRSIPTFHAYKEGQRVDITVGANPTGLTTLVRKQLS